MTYDDQNDDNDDSTTEEAATTDASEETTDAPAAPEHHAHTGLSGLIHQFAESRGIDIDALASKVGISSDQVDATIAQEEGKIPGASALEGLAGQFLGKKEN